MVTAERVKTHAPPSPASLAVCSLSGELDNQAVATDGESLALALLDDLGSLLGGAEGHEASSLGLALIVQHDVDLANIEVHVLECLTERVTISGLPNVAHVDRVTLPRLLMEAAGGREILRLHLLEAVASATATAAAVAWRGVGSGAAAHVAAAVATTVAAATASARVAEVG